MDVSVGWTTEESGFDARQWQVLSSLQPPDRLAPAPTVPSVQGTEGKPVGHECYVTRWRMRGAVPPFPNLSGCVMKYWHKSSFSLHPALTICSLFESRIILCYLWKHIVLALLSFSVLCSCRFLGYLWAGWFGLERSWVIDCWDQSRLTQSRLWLVTVTVGI
jgi:hypothetical protein